MTKTKEEIQSVKGGQLPQYLATLGLNPYQITSVMYGIFKEVKILGKLTPQDDNTIHLTKEKLIKMSKDPLLETNLYGLFLKVQRSKNWAPLFEKGNKNDALTAPDLWHNPSGCAPKLPTGQSEQNEVEIVNFVKFLTECGIDPDIVRQAIEEKMLLKGEN